MNNNFKSKNGIYLIAEVGGNHEGDFEYAKRLTKLAAESNVDAVKFQIYSGDSLVNPEVDPARNAHFKKFQLSGEEYIELARVCRGSGVAFMASVWDHDAFDYIDEYIPIYKIGSGDLTAYNFLKKTALTGKPMILSTGLSDMDEIMDSVKFIESIDKRYIAEKKLALLQCTSMYPIPADEANIAVIRTLKDKTGLVTGYSDHTVGTDALYIAAMAGAEILEFHFTDSRDNKAFRDHKISLIQDEVKELISFIGSMKTYMGDGEKRSMPAEIGSGHVESFRRAVYPAQDIPAGSVIKEKDLITLRPLKGISAENFYNITGKKVKIDLKKYQPLDWDLFE